MKRGKFERTGSKALAMILAVILVLGSVIGGTMAWLIDTTDEVKNTFTYGDINLDLDETDTELDDDDDDNTNEYEMIPGNDIVKDPKITVKADSEACYLFVKLVKSENFDTFLEYEMADGWTLLDDDGDEDPNTLVYYMELDEKTEEDTVYGVLLNDNVHVKEEVTKEQLNELDPEGEDANYPTLTVTAYAVQMANIDTVEAAWELVIGEETAPVETTAPVEPETTEAP